MVSGLKGRAGPAGFGLPVTPAGATKEKKRRMGVRNDGCGWRRCPGNAPECGPDSRAKYRKSLVSNTVARATSVWDAKGGPFVGKRPQRQQGGSGPDSWAPSLERIK